MALWEQGPQGVAVEGKPPPPFIRVYLHKEHWAQTPCVWRFIAEQMVGNMNSDNSGLIATECPQWAFNECIVGWWKHAKCMLLTSVDLPLLY